MQVVVRDHNSNSHQSSKLNEIRENTNDRMQLVFKEQKHQQTTHDSFSSSAKNSGHEKIVHQNLVHENIGHQNLVHEEIGHQKFVHENIGHQKSVHGRGKDTFFLLAQDIDSPNVVRDSRKVPKKVLNQVQTPKKPTKVATSVKKVPTFPNYPVKMDDKPDKELTFHQAFGTDFDVLRSKTIVTTKPKTTKRPTPKPSTFILTPPEVNAPIAKFFKSKGNRRFTRPKPLQKAKKPFQRLPHNHPLRKVLPPRARVVGIQPLRKIALSNRGKKAEIMTLHDFLKKYPDMEKMTKTSIIPVPITDKKHIRMIELLAAKQAALAKAKKKGESTNELDEMFKELEQLISKRAERKISFINSGKNKHSHPGDKTSTTSGAGLAVRPRGGLPGPRFMTTSSGKTTSVSTTKTPKSSTPVKTSTKKQNLSIPELEFGFIPITASTSSSLKTSTTQKPFLFKTSRPSGSSRFRFSNFDDIIDDTDQLVAPRLPRQPPQSNHINLNSIESNEILDSSIVDNDAFFFTTTPKPLKGESSASQSSVASSVSSLNSETSKFKSGIFDMRKFFFIPTKQHHKPKQAERRVHHHNLKGYPQHPVHHRGFFRGRRK